MEEKRFVEFVLDLANGRTYRTADLLRGLSEPELWALRHRLGRSLTRYKGGHPEDRAIVCIHCFQPVYLAGTPKGEHTFKHGPGLKDCPLRLYGGLSPDDIRRIRYNGIQESPKHFALKRHISTALKTTPGFSNVMEEKSVVGVESKGEWKKPDVSAEYREDRIAFEVQLSREFLSVIIEREEFYRTERVFICWVFDDFTEGGARFSEKDIYYANKRNAFSVTEETKALTRETGALVLKCHYQVPMVSNGRITDEWHERYVNFQDLRFDKGSYKVYYYDYDAARERAKAAMKLSREEIDAFEKFWINRESMSGKERWPEKQRWYAFLRERTVFQGDAEQISFGEDLEKTLDAIYSLKHRRLIGYGWRSNQWVQLANTFLSARKKFGGLFVVGLKTYGIWDAVCENETYRERAKEIRDGVRSGNEEFQQDTTYRDLFVLLFPELFIPKTEGAANE